MQTGSRPSFLCRSLPPSPLSQAHPCSSCFSPASLTLQTSPPQGQTSRPPLLPLLLSALASIPESQRFCSDVARISPCSIPLPLTLAQTRQASYSKGLLRVSGLDSPSITPRQCQTSRPSPPLPVLPHWGAGHTPLCIRSQHVPPPRHFFSWSARTCLFYSQSEPPVPAEPASVSLRHHPTATLRAQCVQSFINTQMSDIGCPIPCTRNA